MEVPSRQDHERPQRSRRRKMYLATWHFSKQIWEKKSGGNIRTLSCEYINFTKVSCIQNAEFISPESLRAFS